MNIVSASVWRVLTFALNGIVFVLLGTQLPRAMQRTWENVTIDNDVLIGYILGITVLMLAARFLWVLIMERVHRQRRGRMTLDELRSTAIMTLAGPKGTITLAVAFTIPFSIPQRELLLFLACGVIVVTMLLATFAVPLIAPKKDTDDEDCFDEEPSQYRDTPIGHRRAGGTSNRREPRGHASGRPRLQRAHSPPEEQKRTARRVHGALAPESEPVGTRFHARPP